jgi:hypothetical protein
MAGTDRTTLRRPETRSDHDESDELAHIVMKGDQMRGYVGGEAIQALCGKLFVPSRDYDGLPVCRECAAERDRLLAGMKRLN